MSGSACPYKAIKDAALDDAALDIINPEALRTFSLEIANNADKILQDAFDVLKSQARKNKYALLVAAGTGAGLFVVSEQGEVIAEAGHKYVFGGGEFGQPEDDSSGNDDDDDPTTTKRTTTSKTTSSCNPTATVDENSVCILVRRGASL